MKFSDKFSSKPKLVLNRPNVHLAATQMPLDSSVKEKNKIEELKKKTASSISRNFLIKSVPKLNRAQGFHKNCMPLKQRIKSKGQRMPAGKYQSVHPIRMSQSPHEKRGFADKLFDSLHFDQLSLTMKQLRFALGLVQQDELESLKAFLGLKAKRVFDKCPSDSKLGSKRTKESVCQTNKKEFEIWHSFEITCILPQASQSFSQVDSNDLPTHISTCSNNLSKTQVRSRRFTDVEQIIPSIEMTEVVTQSSIQSSFLQQADQATIKTIQSSSSDNSSQQETIQQGNQERGVIWSSKTLQQKKVALEKMLQIRSCNLKDSVKSSKDQSGSLTELIQKDMMDIHQVCQTITSQSLSSLQHKEQLTEIYSNRLKNWHRSQKTRQVLQADLRSEFKLYLSGVRQIVNQLFVEELSAQQYKNLPSSACDTPLKGLLHHLDRLEEIVRIREII